MSQVSQVACPSEAVRVAELQVALADREQSLKETDYVIGLIRANNNFAAAESFIKDRQDTARDIEDIKALLKYARRNPGSLWG